MEVDPPFFYIHISKEVIVAVISIVGLERLVCSCAVAWVEVEHDVLHSALVSDVPSVGRAAMASG